MNKVSLLPIDSMSEQIEEWSKTIDEGILKERLVNCNKALFVETFTLKISIDRMRCICLTCNTELVLPTKKYGKQNIFITN